MKKILLTIVILMIAGNAFTGTCTKETQCEICGAVFEEFYDCSDAFDNMPIITFNGYYSRPPQFGYTTNDYSVCSDCYKKYQSELSVIMDKQFNDWLFDVKMKNADIRDANTKKYINEKAEKLEARIKDLNKQLDDMKDQP